MRTNTQTHRKDMNVMVNNSRSTVYVIYVSVVFVIILHQNYLFRWDCDMETLITYLPSWDIEVLIIALDWNGIFGLTILYHSNNVQLDFFILMIIFAERSFDMIANAGLINRVKRGISVHFFPNNVINSKWKSIANYQVQRSHVDSSKRGLCLYLRIIHLAGWRVTSKDRARRRRQESDRKLFYWAMENAGHPPPLNHFWVSAGCHPADFLHTHTNDVNWIH